MTKNEFERRFKLSKPAEVKIDIDSIPDREFLMLARAINNAARRTLSTPEGVRQFEVWKAQRAAAGSVSAT